MEQHSQTLRLGLHLLYMKCEVCIMVYKTLFYSCSLLNVKLLKLFCLLKQFFLNTYVTQKLRIVALSESHTGCRSAEPHSVAFRTTLLFIW